MKKKFSIGLLCFLLLLGGYGIWTQLGRTPPSPTFAPLSTLSVTQFGTNQDAGSLLAMQLSVQPIWYASQTHFQRALDRYFVAAKRRKLLTTKTIVVLPEYLGTWLVVAGEKASVYRAKSVTDALTTMVLSNPLRFLWAWLHAHGQDRVKDAVFRMKAQQMAHIYQQTLSALARKYHVTIVGGSIVLPSPSVQRGQLHLGDGPLYNVSGVFSPDGQLLAPLVRKVSPTNEEKPFSQGAAAKNLPTFVTPAGRLGVLICADSWYPRTYRALRKKRVELLAVPAFLAGTKTWDQPWQGYNGGAQPADVQTHDIQRITEGQAWKKYALSGRYQQAHARAGVTAFLRGKLWDLGASGRSFGVLQGKKMMAPPTHEPALFQLWLPRSKTK